MKLAGSCHCRAVRFTVVSHTPYPYMRCYCSICRKTAGGGGFAINIMGTAKSLSVRGKKHVGVFRARVRGKGDARGTLSPGRRHFCAEVRQRSLGLGSALGGMGLSVRVGDRHAVAEAARGAGDHARLRRAVVRDSRPAAATRTSASIPTRESPTGTRSAG